VRKRHADTLAMDLAAIMPEDEEQQSDEEEPGACGDIDDEEEPGTCSDAGEHTEQGTCSDSDSSTSSSDTYGSDNDSDTSSDSSSTAASGSNKVENVSGEYAGGTAASGSKEPPPRGGPAAVSTSTFHTVYWHDFKFTPRVPLSSHVKPSLECTCRLHAAARGTRCTRTRTYNPDVPGSLDCVLRSLKLWALMGRDLLGRQEHQKMRDVRHDLLPIEEELGRLASGGAAPACLVEGMAEPARKRGRK
jgi:hypothetical protein